ncbi:fibrous sheath-interacting protein 2 isoform X2 [Anolis carolinensis]|uniref:fibrous sheath-interacting protein 2 isoform X2 n=1 Tax=Anolis carolinensis TaxID=28377 RepID=UPI002F2B1AF2
MAYPNPGILKAAMGHYLTESARTALEALEPEGEAVVLGPGKQMPVVGPNQILDMPLFTKIPFLPGSNTMFYTTNLGEKLYQPSATFDLSDPYCKMMPPKYKSLHDPHLKAFYKRKDNLRRLKKAGHITDKNKVVCSLKEFNEYRQYLTSLKLEFEKHYIREQKMLEKQVTKLQDPQVLPEGLDTSKYRDWLLKEERPSIREQESVMRNKYLEMINQELEKLEQLAEENRRLALAQDDKKKMGLEKQKQLLLRKKMEEEWKRKEMLLLMKIGDDVKREARMEEQKQKSKEDKLKRKQAMLEKKMAYHLKKLQEKFQKEGFLPPGRMPPVKGQEDHGLPVKKLAALAKKPPEAPRKPSEPEKKRISPLSKKGGELPKGGGGGGGGGGTTATPEIQSPPSKAAQSKKQSITVTLPSSGSEALIASKSATSLEPGLAPSEKDVSKSQSQHSEPAGETLPSQATSGRPSLVSVKEATSTASNKSLPAVEAKSSKEENGNDKVLPSISAGATSNEGEASVEESAVCGSKTSCDGSGGCGSKGSCCGSAGCGSKGSCCGSAGCGSKGCCGSGGCGSKGSCCGSAGCGSKGCCGSSGCGSKSCCCGSKTCCRSSGCRSKGSCCGSCGSKGSRCVCCSSGCCSGKCSGSGVGSMNSKATGEYDSSGSSNKRANDSGPSKITTTTTGVTASHQSSTKPSTKTDVPSAITLHTITTEATTKGKQKKKSTLMTEPEPKDKTCSKKTRREKGKIEHLASTSHENDSESSYSAYLQHLLSNTDQSALRETLKGKVSVCELNGIVQNIMTWVVSAVTSILYPALTKFEERVRARVYTISEESLLSSENSSTCSTCNEDRFEARGGLPSLCAAAATAAAKTPAALLASKSSFASFSLGSDLFRGCFRRGKTAIFFSPAKHGSILSTTTSMRSSKSDSHISDMLKAFPDKASGSHGKRGKGAKPREHGPKRDAKTGPDTRTATTYKEGPPLAGGGHQPPHDPKEPLNLKDLKSLFAELKPPLSKITAIILNDVFKKILGDLGCTATAGSLSMEVLLESISESILGSHPGGSPPAGAISRIACFVAGDLVENVLNKLQALTLVKYVETVSREEFSVECKALCVAAASGRHGARDPASWRPRLPLSLESMHATAEEILHFILDKLKVFAISSQTKVSQFKLFARIKAFGIPLEQFYVALPPHTVESEAANAIVKDTIRKIVSKTVASSETHVLQYVEEMIGSILEYIQRQLSPEGKLPARESSILLQLINDVFNSLSTEKLQGIYGAAKPQIGAPEYDPPSAPESHGKMASITTLFTSEEDMVKPFAPVNVPGMVIYSEVEEKEKTGADGTKVTVNKERKVLVTEVPKGEEELPGKDKKDEAKRLDKLDNRLDNFVQDAIFSSVEIHHESGTRECALVKALNMLEEDFNEEVHSPLVPLLCNLLNELFRLVWAEQPALPPKAPPPSLDHMSFGRQHHEGQLDSKEVLGLKPPVSEADIKTLASDLVKTTFQTISRATQTNASRQPSVVSTTESGKTPHSVHFRNPEASYEFGKGIGKEKGLPTQLELGSDLVQAFVAKLENFVTSKVESQLCLDVQNLKASMSADVSTIPQELRQILVNSQGCLPTCLEDILNACGAASFAEKVKDGHGLPLSYSQLKPYAQEVARVLLKNLKHGLDTEVEKIPTPPVIFSESIAASQVVSMVFTIVAPREYECEEGLRRDVLCKEAVLEKLLRKNAAYKKELQLQIQNTVETFLNEIYQTIMLDMGSPPSEGPEGSQVSKEADNGAPFPLPKHTVVKSDVSVVSNDLVDIVLKDLSSGLAAALHKKGPLSARLQSLLYELVQKTVEPFAHLTGRGAKAGHRGHCSDMQKQQILGLLRGDDGTTEMPQLRDITPQGIAQFLVDNIVLRLERFAQEKLDTEPVQERPGSYRQRAKLAIQDSQSNLKLCAEKLTCSILKVIQKDLEREMLSCQNIVPYEENASANDMVNDLLKILSVQIALTENEVHKSVLKKIFRRQRPGQRGRCQLLARVEDVLNQVTQKVIGDLGHLSSFHDSSFVSSDTRSSHYPGMMEAAHMAGDIVEGVMGKMYTVVMDTLFTSESSSSSDKGPVSTHLQKATLAVAQLHPPPQSLGEELVQGVLNKIASFAASSLEEVLPFPAQPRRRTQYDFQSGDGAVVCRPRAFADDSESSLMRVNLCKSDLTAYAKDVVRKVLGSILEDFKTEEYHRTILRVNTLSSEQISIASDFVHSVAQDLHVSRHTQFESYVKGKPKSLFYEDFFSFLKQVLPKEGILREIFECRPLTDANINETLKMLQVAENIVSEVFMRIRDLESAVCILQRTSGELSEKLFCYGFKRAEGPASGGLFRSDSQAEIGSVARDIVASVFENVQKCLICSVPAHPECFPPKKDPAGLRGHNRFLKHRFTQPDFPFYNVSLKGAVDNIDKIAKEAVECVVLMLETFAIRHFRRDFKCNFLEIVNFPLDSLSFAQLTRSLDSVSVGNVAETTVEAFWNKIQGPAGRGALPTLGSDPNFMDFSKLGGAVTRECIETSIRQVQALHAELNIYANNAVSGILEIIKHTLDQELSKKEASLFSSSSDSIVLSETLSVMLDRCNESLTEITSELMVENLQLEMSGRRFAKEKSLMRDLPSPPRLKTKTTRYSRVEARDSFPPINVPGMVIYSEEEAEVLNESPPKFPPVYKDSEWDAPERGRGASLGGSRPRSRPPARRNMFRVEFQEDDWLPRERDLPEGSILEKLFKKAAEPEPGCKAGKTAAESKAGAYSHADPFGRGLPLHIPENVCYSAVCPLKLGQTAETIVNTLLCEFGLGNEGGGCEGGGGCCRKPCPAPHLGCGEIGDLQRKWPSLLDRWEQKNGNSGGHTVLEGSLLVRQGSSLLSKWESKHCLFRSKSPTEMELLACSHVPDPDEVQMLATHIVLSVIKELIIFQPKDVSREKAPAWKHELQKSESKWLQERIWRSTFLPSAQRQSSCLEVFWEPLTLAVVTNVLLTISHPNARGSPRGKRKGFFGSPVSMFCSVESPAGSPKSGPVDIEELAFHLSEAIVGLLCERHVLHAGVKKKGYRGKRSRYIYVPPLCLADFDCVYHRLVREVGTLLSLEIEMRGKFGGRAKPRDPFPQPRGFDSPYGASRGDCRGPEDLKGPACLYDVRRADCKSPRLSCVAANLDRFIRGLQSSEAKHLVNKVLQIILDSLWEEKSPTPPTREGALTPKKSLCPHASRLSGRMVDSPLGLSPKSVVLLDIVSEKLIRALLDKCLTTEHFTGAFAFDEFPEDEQLCHLRKCVSDEEILRYHRREARSRKVDADSSVFTYDVKYSEEPGVEAQTSVTSYDSALDLLAHTLVKPVMTELSLNLEPRGSLGHARHRKPRQRHTHYGRVDGYFSLPRPGKKPEPRTHWHGRRPGRRNVREHRGETIVEADLQRRTFTSKPPGRAKPRTTAKKVYRREIAAMSDRGDHRSHSPAVSAVYSSLFLEEVISQFLIKVFSSLETRYDKETCIGLKEMNALFVNALVDELRRGSVRVLRGSEEKTYFPQLDRQAVDKLSDSILGEFGFQLAANKGFGRSVEAMAERAAEIILTEVLDYQLPPTMCRRLPMNSCKSLKPERILQRIELCICFPKAHKRRPPPPAHPPPPPPAPPPPCPPLPPPPYVTILSQKYLESVINRLLTQLFPALEGPPRQERDRGQLYREDFEEICSYMIKEVMRSISKHKIWVSKQDDKCRLHSKKEVQNMVDSVYKNMLEKSGSQQSIQKEVKSRDSALIDTMASFIIQEITKQHLQTFLSQEELPSQSPDPEALSESIVKKVLDTIKKPLVAQAEVFSAKVLEEIMSRVLSKVFQKKEATKGQRKMDLANVAKRLANQLNLRFGQAATALTEGPRGEDQGLGAPLTNAMDYVVDSVCDTISKEKVEVPGGDLVYAGEGALMENIKRLVEKCVADYFLHPLFSGEVFNVSIPPLPRYEEIAGMSDETEGSSPFSTFLSSGFLKDLITGLLSKIFSSSSPREKHLPSASDLNKLATQLLDDIRRKLLKHEIRVTGDALPGQDQYTEEDVQNMTDSLCSQIIRKSGSLEAVQREVRNKSNALIDWIAGFLVGNVLQQHVQPFVAKDEDSSWDAAAAGDSTGRLEVYRTRIQPRDLRPATQEKVEEMPSPSSFLGGVLSELISKLSSTLSDLPLGASGDTAVQLAKTLTKELAKGRFNLQDGPEHSLGPAPPPPPPLEDDWRPPRKDLQPCWSPEEHSDVERDTLEQKATAIFGEAVNHLIQTTRSSKVPDNRCLIQEKMMEEVDGPEVKPPAAYTTVISYPVLEGIIEGLFCRVFPEEGLRGSDQVAQAKRTIMETVLKQAIWASTYGCPKRVGLSDEAVAEMVESVYCDVLHEVLLRQPFPEDKESLSNLYVTQIACFILNEIFKYHLQSLGDASEGESCLTVFPCRLLEDMLSQLLDKIFPTPESIANYVGKQADFSESDFVEMATNLKSDVVTEILAHEIKLENRSERSPEMDHETKEDIANSVYNQVLQRYTTQKELQDALTVQASHSVEEVTNFLVRELLNFHLQPFLSGGDSSSDECTNWQKERQLFSRRIYSAAFLEDIVVAFFCKILSSPNILTYTKEAGLPEDEMRSLVIELVNALVAEFKTLQVKVFQSMEEDSCFPQIAPETVVLVCDSIYEKLLELLGSECEIFKAFQTNIQTLAEKLAPLMVREISGYQLLPLFTGDTSPYLFSFLEAETILDRVETILPEAASPRSVFGDMFVKILRRIFPLSPPAGAEAATKERKGSEAKGSMQSLMENIYKTVCKRVASPERKHEELAGFPRQTRPDRSCSPPAQPNPSSTIVAQSGNWTIHHVKLGEGESRMTQAEDGGDVYSPSFLKDIFSGLVSKLLSSTAPETRETEAESPLKNLMESILREFAKSKVKVLQVPEAAQPPPSVGKTEVAKIIHSSLCNILRDQGSGGALLERDQQSQHALAERLAEAIKKEILGYHVQVEPDTASEEPASKPFEFGEMAKKVWMEVKKISTPSPSKSQPSLLLVSQRFIHDVLGFLLTKILPPPTEDTGGPDTQEQCDEFDFIHMKLLSKVMDDLAKDKSTEVQYLDPVQTNRVVSQTVANSVYNNLLPEFGTTSTVQKCVRAGCSILLERIADFVIKEISGSKMQTYFSEERSRQQEAMEAKREMEQCYGVSPEHQYGDGSEPKEGETQLRSHLKGLSIIILEEVAAKFLSKMVLSLSSEEMDERILESVKDVARKIVGSLQKRIEKNKLQVWQNEEEEDLGSEQSQAVGEVVDSVYMDVMKQSGSEASLYKDLTNKNEDLVNRVACFMVSEISRRDFPAGTVSEDELPRSSTDIKLQSDKIIQKFLDDIEMEKGKKETAGVPGPVVPVAFLEEILSRFLTTIFLEQCDLGIHEKKRLSITEVNEIACLLKTSVEKMISKNNIGLLASSEDEPTLDPQYEEVVNKVVHSVISNVMEKSGSQQELYKDMTTSQVIFPEQVASIIINEISSCNIRNPPNDNAANETCSALALDRIVSKVIAQVSSHMESQEDDDSLAALTGMPKMKAPEGAGPEVAGPEALLQGEEMPVKIVPCIGHKPIRIDPGIISDHLAVLSIKTEPLEKLKKTCLSRIGISLTELRRASASGKSITQHDLGIPEVSEDQRKKERRSSLDIAGRLGVRPKEAVCRNSFQSLIMPDIRKVELLKDVESKQDLIVRLVAHDIDEDQAHRFSVDESDTDEDEQVLSEHRSFYFEVPPLSSRGASTDTEASGPLLELPSVKTSITGILRKSSSGAGPEAAKEAPEPPEMEPAPQSVPSTQEAPLLRTFSLQTSLSSKPSDETVPSQKESLEKAAVDMHLTRDTEESGPVEITSVYQDRNMKDSISEEHSEAEDGKVLAVTTSDTGVTPRQQRSSVFEKVSSALSRVFSRTSATAAHASPSASSQDKAAATAAAAATPGE